MKKIFFCSVISIMFLPLFASAALKAPPTLAPLQPMPENTAPNIKSNTNTPGNEYNQTQDQIQSQDPNSEEFEAGTEETPNPVQASQTPDGSKAGLYVILIVVCTVGLLSMLSWVYYRYRIKKN